MVGSFRDQTIRRLIVVCGEAVDDRGYEDIVLDFSGCTGAFASAMLPICAHVLLRRQQGITFTLELPPHGLISNLFLNTNWANFINPERWDRSTYAGHIHLPATQFSTATEQHHAIDALVNAILGSVQDLTRSDFAAIEWALNEIADNVLVHAESPVGGLVQVTTFNKKNQQVAFVVADAGLGIPTTMRTTHMELVADSDALFQAIREGVTRDKSVGQGNGLFGTLEICRVSGGTFSIGSGQGLLYYNEDRGVHARKEQLPFPGTVVAGTIELSDGGTSLALPADALSEAVTQPGNEIKTLQVLGQLGSAPYSPAVVSPAFPPRPTFCEPTAVGHVSLIPRAAFRRVMGSGLFMRPRCGSGHQIASKSLYG